MKVLLINNVHYRRGGADIVYLNTGEMLGSMGHDVYYFSQKNENNEFVNHQNRMYFIESIDYFKQTIIKKILLIPRFIYSREVYNKLIALIKQYKPDVAHIHLYKGSLSLSILHALKKNNIPVLLTLHDYGLICAHNLMLDSKNTVCEKCIKYGPLSCIINKCNRNNIYLSAISMIEYVVHKYWFNYNKYFDIIVAVSRFGRDIHNRADVFKDGVRHLYNFFPKIQMNEELLLRGNYYLFYGRLSKEKGVKTLINAWVKKKRKSLLKIVGDGPDIEDLKRLSGNDHDIEFLGYKCGDELKKIIMNASFVIVPSEWYENNPLTIVESMSSSKPVIGTKIGGIPELINHGENGYLYNVKDVDQLSEIISYSECLSNDKYFELAKNARQFAVKTFDEVSHYKELMSLYNELINKKK